MNIKKMMMAVAIIGTTSLFATSLSQITILVDQINTTKNAQAKQELVTTLEKTVKTLDEKDYNSAQEIIKKDLKPIN